MPSLSLEMQLNDYIERIREIKALSSEIPDELSEASDYNLHLTENFKEIEALAERNRKFLDSTLYPLLSEETDFSDDTVSTLQDFCRELLNSGNGDGLDLSLLFHVSKRLLFDAMQKEDDDYIVEQLYQHINACHANVTRTSRVQVSNDLSRFYQKEGLDASRVILSYLPHGEFKKLKKPESRKKVLVHSRFYVSLYDTFYVTPLTNDERVDRLFDAYRLSEDEFYTTEVPDYDWNYHKLRCLEQLGRLTECGNSGGFSEKQNQRIMEAVDELERLWNTDIPTYSEVIPEAELELIIARNAYLNDRISADIYRKRLLALQWQWAIGRYDPYSIRANIFVLVEYLTTLDEDYLTEEQRGNLDDMYRRVLSYVLHADSNQNFDFMLEYLSMLLDRFIEIPGGITFEEMGLSCLLALHPPTYIHSIQIAKISRCLCAHALNTDPSALIGVLGCTNTDEVIRKKTEILSHIYHAALCHDFGKISMLDTIAVYGRDLLDSEFEIIKCHPNMGAALLSRYHSTRTFVDIARGHHKWYDDSFGYPEWFETDGLPDKPLIDIVSVADSIDAATDKVGRSYSKGKRLSEVLNELSDGTGDRYAPFVVDLMQQEEVLSDIEYLIRHGRESNYRDTYFLLRDTTEI